MTRKKQPTAVSRNSWFLSFLAGNYSKGKLYIFTTNYKVAATGEAAER